MKVEMSPVDVFVMESGVEHTDADKAMLKRFQEWYDAKRSRPRKPKAVPAEPNP